MTQLFIAEQGSESMGQTHAYSIAISVCRIAWAGFAIAGISQALVEQAGVFAEASALSGYGSVQRPTPHQLHQHCALPLTFVCFDRRLNLAAKLPQLQVFPS